jgi:CHAT domain-containing protein
MLLRAIQFLKARWRQVAIVLTMPLVLGGIITWTADTRVSTREGASGFRSVISPRPAEWPPKPVVSSDPSLDRGQQIRELREQLDAMKSADAPGKVNLGQILIQLGKLESAEGNDEAAATAYREVSSLHADAAHWQVREATLRLAALDRIAKGPEDDRRVWREAIDQQLEAEALQVKGHYRDATRCAEEALTGRRRLWGADHVETAESLLRLAWLSTEHADFYLRAEGLAREALEATRRALGEEHPTFADCLYVAATLADDRGEFSDADSQYERALDVYRRSIGELSREYARALNRQGRMHNTWWKDYSAGKSFKALEIRERILDREHPDCAESREDAAEVQYGLLHYEQAEAQLEKAIEIRGWRQGQEHPDLARPYSLLAACQAEHGMLSPALVNIRRALVLTERWRGARHPLMAFRQVLWGKICIRSNDYSVGYRALTKARATLADLGLQKHPTYCEAVFQQAESLWCDGTHQLDESDSASMLAARPMMEEAVAAYRALPQAEKIGYFADALLGLSETYYYLNYPDDTRNAARQLIEEAQLIVDRNGGILHPLYSVYPIMQGRFCVARGHYDAGLRFHKTAAERVLRKVGTAAPWLYVDSLQGLAGAYFRQGTNLEAARDRGLEAFQICDAMYRRNAAGESDSSRVAAMGDSYMQLCASLSIAEAMNDQASLYDMALAVRGAATSFQRSHRLAHDRPELQGLLEKIREERQVLKERVFADEVDERQEAWVERVLAASERKENAECELAMAIRPLVPDDSPVTLHALQSALPDNTAFVDFIQYIHHSSPPEHIGRLVRQLRILAFVIRSSGPPFCIPLGPSRMIEKAVNGWRDAIIDFQQGGTGDIEAPARELAGLVWSPIVAHLEGIDDLYIAPDGPLCFVSFAAMPGRKPRTFALDDYLISYVNSGRWLYEQLQNEEPATGAGLLVCGDITYERPGVLPVARARPGLLSDPREWKNLAATGLEIEKVSELYASAFGGSPEALSGSQADARTLESKLAGNWRCIHFAGHGFFVEPDNVQALAGHIEALGKSACFVQRNQLLLSGLITARDPRGSAAHSILTAEEVGSLDLRGTDLVVLSACDTGLGCSAGADGVLGLTRAFLTAGSRSVVSSLWKVEDAATSLLMEEFYRNLWERRLSKREALREAQKAVLNAPQRIYDRAEYLALRGLRAVEPGKTRLLPKAPIGGTPQRCHPALWAAFVLNGDGR